MGGAERDFIDIIEIVQVLKVRESLDNLSGSKVTHWCYFISDRGKRERQRL